MRYGWMFRRSSLTIYALVGLLCATLPEVGAESTRSAVCAGSFYPASNEALVRQIDGLVARAAASDLPRLPAGRLRALVMPHAGYLFSGLTAAHAVRLTSGCRFAKVVVLGPDHRIGFPNAAVSDADAWLTPLGTIPVHPDASRLRQSNLFQVVAASDRQEHCIEVTLPFLQYAIQDFQLVPVVMGPGDIAGMTEQIDAIIDDDTLLVVSSDLSHGLPKEKAAFYDRQTLDAVIALDAPAVLKSKNSACGKIPLAVLIAIARDRHWQPVLIHYSNSGDVPQGSDDWIVGYATLAFYGDDAMSKNAPPPIADSISESQGQLLIRLARQTIAKRLGLPIEGVDAYEQALADPAFQRRSGTFVTLKLDGQLRGCIGSLASDETIGEGIRSNALNAAFSDYRFAPLTAEELKRVVIEVSILTSPAPLAYANAEDLINRLRPGVDGVILSKAGRSATFLPQVWDQLPAKEDFLNHLCLKAGLKADAWRSGDVMMKTYQVVYFEETH